VWIVLAAVAVLMCTALAMFASRRNAPPSEPHHLWTVSRANTSDGATARLEVEVAVEFTDGRLQRNDTDTEIVDAVGEEIRQRIIDHPVASLPSVGDDAPFVNPDVVTGVRIVRAVVTASDVEVTPELRRLVTDRSTT
jgi:hypothetical protein